MIEISLIILWFILFSIIFYVFFMCLLGSFPEQKDLHPIPLITKFAIIVPAHNESGTIEKTLESLQHIDYPKNLYDVYVILDNCSDNTAEVSQKMGAMSLERRDDQNRGKGHVLKWFFKKVIEEKWGYDVFLIVDADSIVTDNILTAMNKRFYKGAAALTSTYSILNPGSSVPASIAYIGFLLRNLRYHGIHKIKGSVPLLGNGMGFSWKIIEKYGWDATSITEDREYWAILHNEGVKVGFVEEASVYGKMPETFKNYEVPRARWDLGEFDVAKKYFLLFLKILIKRKNATSFIALLELLTPPLTVSFALTFIFLPFLILLTRDFSLMILGLINIFFLVLTLWIGYLKSNRNWKIYKKFCLYLLFFILWRLWNTMKGLLGHNRKEWIRTPRS